MALTYVLVSGGETHRSFNRDKLFPKGLKQPIMDAMSREQTVFFCSYKKFELDISFLLAANW